MGTSNINGLTGVLIMMIFYSISITSMAYFFPSYITPYGDMATQNIDTNVTGIVNTVDLSVQDQSSLPLVEISALLFYTGNLFFDLILNFINIRRTSDLPTDGILDIQLLKDRNEIVYKTFGNVFNSGTNVYSFSPYFKLPIMSDESGLMYAMRLVFNTNASPETVQSTATILSLHEIEIFGSFRRRMSRTEDAD